MARRIAILGSTGSIGRKTLDVLEYFPNLFDIFAIAGYADIERLASQAKKHRPALVGIGREDAPVESLAKQDYDLLFGPSGLRDIACHPDVDIVVIAIPGSSCLMPTWAAVEAGKQVGLASKEAMVMIGPQLVSLARKTGSTILPIDSELGSIWQGIQGKDLCSIRKVFITCSGGALRDYRPEDLDDVSVSDVLEHPTWPMGRKITVDSATLMNKAFEVIASHVLFGLSLDQIEVLLHPQSYVHSMIEYLDGNVEALIGNRDMRLFIQSVLCYPVRLKGPVGYLDWTQVPPLTFEPVDLDRTPSLRTAYDVCKRGGTYPTVFSSANDAAVALFLSSQIRFPQIVEAILQVIDQHQCVSSPGLQDVIDADRWAKNTVSRILVPRTPPTQ